MIHNNLNPSFVMHRYRSSLFVQELLIVLCEEWAGGGEIHDSNLT